MKLSGVLFLGSLVCASLCAQSWNHDLASSIGPNSWGYIGGTYNGFATCGTDKQAVGAKQTPIDIVTKNAAATDLFALKFHYEPISLVVENLNHVIEVVNEEATNTLSVGTTAVDTYKLLQFHFHGPSEHKIDGAAADLEAHFVHQNALGELAVVGVMLKVDNAKANKGYDLILNNAPSLTFFSASNSQTAPLGELKLEDLLPENRGYYTYTGSLTTPPCSEGVHWFVMKDPVYVSAGAVANHKRVITENSRIPTNNRPVQPLNNRPVLVTK